MREGLTGVRMLELARADPEQPYRGGRTVFDDLVRRVRREQARQQAAHDVPIRFEGLPAEYLQVDWGEIRRFPFTQQPATTRYFLTCRLKYSRWSWVCFTDDMRQETLMRGLVACFVALGWVPWVLVFDNMKTVTSGRDGVGQPASGHRRCGNWRRSFAFIRRRVIPRPATRKAVSNRWSSGARATSCSGAASSTMPT